MTIDRTLNRKWIALIIDLGLIAAYFLLFRKLISSASASLIEMIVLGVLVLLAAGTLLVGLYTLVRIVFSKDRAARRKKLGSQMSFLLIILTLLAAIVLGSQWAANTPLILGVDGKPQPGSIATLEKVQLGGVEQSLIIRGQNVNKPVLLFLSGGPGASEAARVLRFNQELEKHFVVVIWEQRGCGKSYPSLNPKAKLTLEQYTSDIIELSEILRTRFDEKKIYLVGHVLPETYR